MLQLLSLPDISLPSLPFLSLLAGAIHAGRSGVAQVLAALSWGVDPPAPHNQDQWGRVVEAAAVKVGEYASNKLKLPFNVITC